MAEQPTNHWQTLYGKRDVTELSWYQEIPETSLKLIRATGIARTAPILDVGGGASTLVDHLLAAGYSDLTVLDLAPLALAQARTRIAAGAERVHWITADILQFRPERRYALWHDRAVLHFLLDPLERRRYVDILRAALALEGGGHLIISAFGPQGPERCSGLPVQRYSAEQLSALLGPDFRLMRSELEEHVTPKGDRQQFLYGWWTRTD